MLKIFHTSDVHGNIFPTNYVDYRPIGFAKISSLINHRKAENNLILDSGDVLQGSSLAFYIEKNKVANPSIIDAYNLIGYDAITLGNHEFNYGLDYLASNYQKFNKTILCANIEGLPFATKPYNIFEYDGCKVAVIGLTTDYIPHWEQPDNITALTFLDPIATYQKYEAEMVANSDIIVVNYHGGFESDLETATTLTEPDTRENIGSRLTHFDSIDLILSGHQHRQIKCQTNGTYCLQPGAMGALVGEVTIDTANKSISMIKLIETANYDPDPMITDYFEQLNQDCNKYLDTKLSTLDRDLLITDVADARLNGHPLLSFLGQAFNDYQPVDVIALSLFDTAIGFDSEVTIRQVNQNYPFPNTLMKIEISGANIIKAIEQSNLYYTLEDDQITINRDFIYPKLKHYNYDMFWGVNYTVTVTESKNIISNVMIKGQPIDVDKTYTMLVSNYRYNNRGDYPVYEDVKLISESTEDALEILLNYFANNPKVTVADTINYTITK